MDQPTLTERWQIARLARQARQGRRLARALQSRALRWRLVAPLANEFMFVPPSLRPVEPGFFRELASGQLGLAGYVVEIGNRSPFSVEPPDRRWAEELHNFSWLANLEAEGSSAALSTARSVVADWLLRHRASPGGKGVAGRPDVIARRILAWMAGAGFLLEEAPPSFYATFARGLGANLRALDAARHGAEPGYQKLLCLIALNASCLTLAGHRRDRARFERLLLAELSQQFLGDGCHVTRNPEVVVDALLDLLPLRQGYIANELEVPRRLNETIDQALQFVRAMSHEPGRVARFNGGGSPRPDVLATVLALEPPGSPREQDVVPPSGYVGLRRGRTSLLADCAPAPPLIHAARSHAGCLAFELVHDGEAVIVNRGAPIPAHRTARRDARATLSHSTLTLNGQSSARFVSSPALEAITGAPVVRGPDTVTAKVSRRDNAVAVEASHNGYLSRFGLLHVRRIELSPDGRRIDGMDTLRPPKGTLRLARDIPCCLHFHIPLNAAASVRPDGSAIITTRTGQSWRLSSPTRTLAIETATDYAQMLGPSPARQIVLREACPGELTLAWRLERIEH